MDDGGSIQHLGRVHHERVTWGLVVTFPLLATPLSVRLCERVFAFLSNRDFVSLAAGVMNSNVSELWFMSSVPRGLTGSAPQV